MGKSILITGCSDNGLGAALAIAFQKAGYRVIASARNTKKLNQVTAAGCETIQLDVLSPESLKTCAEELGKRLNGKLDILLNNAGGMCALPITDLDLKNVRDVFELNTFSLITSVQTFLPLLRAAPQGWIINNTSVAGKIAVPMQSAYSASKSAASMFTKTLRLELEPFNIKVVELCTGAVKSAIFDNTHSTDKEIPPNSIYIAGKKDFDASMGGGELMGSAPLAEEWARQVVADLSRKTPPEEIWRGEKAFLVKLAVFLPDWITGAQGIALKMSGLESFRRIVASQKKGQ